MDKSNFIKVVKIIEKNYGGKIRKSDPFEILVHGILSTRTKDTTTFPAQKRLLKVAGTPEKISAMNIKTIEKLIYPVGFYKTKARLIKKACSILVDKFNSDVPDNKPDLMSIPGVGPKVASLVLEWGFNKPFIAVDTHVNRVVQRLGFVKLHTKPEDTEGILEKSLSNAVKQKLNSSFVVFGREICRPINPKCYICPVYDYCEFYMKDKYTKNYN